MQGEYKTKQPARHRALGSGMGVKLVGVFCRFAPFAVPLMEVILVRPHSFREVLGFSNVRSGAVGTCCRVHYALRFFRRCVFFGPKDEPAHGGGWHVGNVDPRPSIALLAPAMQGINKRRRRVTLSPSFLQRTLRINAFV